MHYLLFYEAEGNYAERRTPYRAEHLALAEEYVARGELVLAGALAEPIDGAVFLFQGSSPAAAEAFAKRDPYVQNGLVKSWRVRTWPTVVGKDAAAPLSSAAFR
ncbi:MAG: YciI-like protein [Deltaproteobacteria bacterium]